MGGGLCWWQSWEKATFYYWKCQLFLIFVLITCCDTFALSFFYLPILSFLLPSLSCQFSSSQIHSFIPFVLTEHLPRCRQSSDAGSPQEMRCLDRSWGTHTVVKETSNKCCLWVRVDFRWASLVAQMVMNLPVMGSIPGLGSIWVRFPGVGKILWRRAWQPTPVSLPGESPRTEEPAGLQSMGVTNTTQWLSIAQRRF